MELKLTEEIWFSSNTLEELRRNGKPGKQVTLEEKRTALQESTRRQMWPGLRHWPPWNATALCDATAQGTHAWVTE